MDDTRIEDAVDWRMVSVSENVDSVEALDMDDERKEDVQPPSEPDLEDAGGAPSCLCAPQCMSGIEVYVSRTSVSRIRIS